MKPLGNLQGGYILYQLSLAIALVTLIAYSALPRIAQYRLSIYRTATVAGLNEIAQAGKAYYADDINASTWPADVATLVANNYLGLFQNRNGYGYPYSLSVNGASLIITTQASGAVEANALSNYFGGLALVAGDMVSVSWSVPGTDTNHEALVQRDGSRDVFGTITHRAGSGANLVMSGNNITTAGAIDATTSLTVRNAGSTGLVDADIGAIDVLTVNEIRITP